MTDKMQEIFEEDTPEFDEVEADVEEETQNGKSEKKADDDAENVLDDEPEDEIAEETEEKTKKEPVEEYDEIVYNGKTIKIPVSERKDYLQRGYNYAKLSGELDTTRRELNELKRMLSEVEAVTGKPFAEVSKELRTKAIEEKAVEIGVEPALLEEQMNMRAKLNLLEAELYKQRREANIAAEKAKLKDRPFFSDLEADIDAMLVQSPDLSVEAAYIFLRGERFDELMEKAKDKTAQRVTAEYQERAKRTVPTNEKPKKQQYSPVIRDLARKMGLNV